MLTGALSRAAEHTLPVLPGALTGPIAELAGTIAYRTAAGARRAVRSNLSVIAPDARGREALVRRVFVEQTRNYIELFGIPRMDPKRLLAQVRLEGWEHFLRAFAQGKGVIVASGHVGPISIVGQMLNAHGYPVVLPIEPERSEFQRAVNRARASAGLQFVPLGSTNGIIRVLRQGKVLGILADRAVTGVGERVPFFGREALMPSGPVVLAMRTGAPLLPAFAGRSHGVMTASIEPPLEIPNTGDRAADVREGVRRFAEVLERYVRRAPEQWTVFEDVWAERGSR